MRQVGDAVDESGIGARRRGHLPPAQAHRGRRGHGGESLRLLEAEVCGPSVSAFEVPERPTEVGVIRNVVRGSQRGRKCL